jgi:hypothetical protein
MKYLVSLLIAAAVTLCGFQSFAGAGGAVGEKFVHTVYLKGTATGGSGQSYSSPKPFVDGDLWAIPAGTVIEKVYVIVDTAITGTTVLEVGDDDDPNGFVVDIGGSFGTAGMYGWDAKAAGADLRISTAGATDAADIYVVPSAKYYSASGKEVKLNITTANTAGRARVVIEGYYAGTK